MQVHESTTIDISAVYPARSGTRDALTAPLADNHPPSTLPVMAPEGVMLVTVLKYSVVVAVPLLAPVRVSLCAFPSASVPTIAKVMPELLPVPSIETC